MFSSKKISDFSEEFYSSVTSFLFFEIKISQDRVSLLSINTYLQDIITAIKTLILKILKL